MIVVDANLPVYLYLEGPKTGEAEDVLRRDRDWIVPPLWQPEFLNVMCLYVRQDVLSEEDAIDRYERARQLVSAVEAT